MVEKNVGQCTGFETKKPQKGMRACNLRFFTKKSVWSILVPKADFFHFEPEIFTFFYARIYYSFKNGY